MNEAKAEAAKGLAICVVIIWVVVAAAYPVISYFYHDHMIKFTKATGLGVGFVDFMTLSPGSVAFGGLLLSLLFFVHWLLCGLFGKSSILTRPIANMMLAATGIAALLQLFENAAADFFEFSLFCQSGEPTYVILIDEVYQCKRAMQASSTSMWIVFLFPLVAIPTRILESRFGKKTQ